MRKKHLSNIIIGLIFAFAVTLSFASCIEDGFTTSPSNQPSFSADTLNIGDVYTAELTQTSRFIVYNRHSKGLNVEHVSVKGENAGFFRVNVDGMSGREFSNIEIRANDSIFVFVEAVLPENGTDFPQTVEAELEFLVNGVKSSVVITATGQDITRLKGVVINESTRLSAQKPYRVIDSLVVAENATLTLDPGVKIFFHDKAVLRVKGTIICKGTPEQPIRLTGDRTGEVIPNVSFDIMSRQWDGVEIMETSSANQMEYTEISNTTYGVNVFGKAEDVDQKKLTLINCKLRNSGSSVLMAFNASIEAVGCEFAEGAEGLVVLMGGNHRFDLCTASNHYLFAAVSGAAWNFIQQETTEDGVPIAPTRALITNSITYGLGADVEPGDLSGSEIYFKRCLFKSEGSDDDNFVECIWNADPLFYTVREKYIFDYRLKPDSPAIGTAFTDLSESKLLKDFYGEERLNDLGAYVFVPPLE